MSKEQKQIPVVGSQLNPKNLFLIDGFGALLSAFLLGVVLVRLEHFIGMPRNTLYFLAFLPCLFAVYDVACYFRMPENWPIFLKGIAIANLLYCCLSILLLVQHYPALTTLGVLYFVIECIIVLVLAGIEFKIAIQHSTKK